MRALLAVCVCVAVPLFACGPIEEDPTAGPLGVLRQAGKTAQGKTAQGKTAQGKTAQGSHIGAPFAVSSTLSVRGVNKQGTFVYTTTQASLVGTDLNGLTTSYVVDQNEFRTTKASNPPPLAKLTAYELDDLGDVVTGTTRQLRITNTSLDSGPYDAPGFSDSRNLLDPYYRAQQTGSIRFYKVELYDPATVSWVPYCEGELGNRAVFLNGYFDRRGAFIDDRGKLSLACWDGVATKCMRWGYRPWTSLQHPTRGTVALKGLWQSCVRAGTADYCGQARSFTENWTTIDIWDEYGFIAKTGKTDDWADAFSDESSFDENGAVCLVRERRYMDDLVTAQCISDIGGTVPPSPYCVPLPTSPNLKVNTCSPLPATGVVKMFDRGGLASCVQTSARESKVFIASNEYACSHDPRTEGRAMAADCNCVTRAICTLPDPAAPLHPWRLCCGEDNLGHLQERAWDAQCAQKARELAMVPSSACPPVLSGF